MNLDNQLWAQLIDFSKRVDGLFDRVVKKTQQTPPISREIVSVASVEVIWQNLPTNYSAAMSPNSDAQWGNNIKRGIFTNKGSRLYIREVGYELYGLGGVIESDAPNARLYPARSSGPFGVTMPYFKWNMMTSITQRQYADKRVSMRSLGRPENGSHLVFREPFILEPMETLTVECELLQYGSVLGGAEALPALVVSMDFFGYREGM